MMRRGRDGRARHSAWSETRQETDAVVVTQISDWEDWDSPTTQMGDLEAEASSAEAAVEAAAVAALPCSGAPVTGESFCQCPRQEELGLGFSVATDCLCGEEDQGFDWVWDEHCKSSGAFLSCDDRKVSFHSDYSCGTAAIRGTKELAEGQHFWEVKMTSPVYGTDMMVGIGTSEVNLEKFTHIFGSLLGHDEDSWGLSYTGLLQNKGDKVKFSSRFGQGSIIGMHLDTWHGTLTFYKNRHCIGVAATRLPNKKFYPMACSTAAKSSMKVIRARYTPTSLQYFCCARLRQMLPGVPDIRDVPDLPPGLGALLHSRLGWVFNLDPADSPEVFPEEPSPLSTSSSLESALSSPFPDAAAASYPCPCQTPPQGRPCTCLCPPTPPSSDYESCCSDPEDYQCKRCRWT